MGRQRFPQKLGHHHMESIADDQPSQLDSFGSGSWSFVHQNHHGPLATAIDLEWLPFPGMEEFLSGLG